MVRERYSSIWHFQGLTYFMKNINGYCNDNYVPSSEDKLRNRIKTTGIIEVRLITRDALAAPKPKTLEPMRDSAEFLSFVFDFTLSVDDKLIPFLEPICLQGSRIRSLRRRRTKKRKKEVDSLLQRRRRNYLFNVRASPKRAQLPYKPMDEGPTTETHHCIFFAYLRLTRSFRSVNDYDVSLEEASNQNALIDSIQQLRIISELQCFTETPFMVFFNKFDLLPEKIKKGKVLDNHWRWRKPKKVFPPHSTLTYPS